MDSYHTINKSAEGPVFKDKKSKFIGYAFPLHSETDVNTHLEFIRQKHPDAGHICYAWQLGNENKKYRVNDDGEPHNSAGMPILGQIKALGLTNILVAVIRYYGGKKLGVGGLINAYRTAAKQVLANASIKETEFRSIVQILCTYPMLDKVLQIARRKKWEIISKEMGDNCKVSLSVKPKEIQIVSEELAYLDGVKRIDRSS